MMKCQNVTAYTLGPLCSYRLCIELNRMIWHIGEICLFEKIDTTRMCATVNMKLQQVGRHSLAQCKHCKQGEAISLVCLKATKFPYQYLQGSLIIMSYLVCVLYYPSCRVSAGCLQVTTRLQEGTAPNQEIVITP